ncbi:MULTISPECIES: hypothetical protein [Komagataeibacter]|nr:MULTISPECIES: hypothetical protein [Komagataeibacter]
MADFRHFVLKNLSKTEQWRTPAMPTMGFAVTQAQKDQIEEMAGSNVSDYIRRAVLGQANTDGSLHAIEERLVSLERNMHRIECKWLELASNRMSDGEAVPPELAGVMLESLMLLRSIVSPAKLDAAKADVKRSDLPVWSL